MQLSNPPLHLRSRQKILAEKFFRALHNTKVTDSGGHC